MNDVRMTLRLPGEYLEFARNYAREREMTLTDLVIGYFKKLKESMAVKEELPMVLECELVSYDKSDCRMVGKIVNVGIDEVCCDGEKADVAKIDPISYDPISHLYLRFGETVAKAFDAGRVLR